MLNFVWRGLGIVNNYPLDIATKIWARGLFNVIGGEAIIETSKKIPLNEPTIMMYMHSSFYDPVVVGANAPITAKYIFKKELIFLFPFVFIAALIAGHVPINRSKRASAIDALKDAAEAVKKNKRSITIAPEGTRSPDGTLQPFKKGPFYLAKDSEVKHVIPIAVFGTYELWPLGQFFPLPGLIRAHYLDPVPTAGTDLETLSARVHEALEKEIERVEKLKLHPKYNPSTNKNVGPAIIMILFSLAFFWVVYSWYQSGKLFR